MDKNTALKLAVDTLHKEWKYFLYASDSDFSNKYRAKLAEAIEVLVTFLEEKKDV